MASAKPHLRPPGNDTCASPNCDLEITCTLSISTSIPSSCVRTSIDCILPSILPLHFALIYDLRWANAAPVALQHMPPKGFEDIFALWLKRNPKNFLTMLMATSIAIDHFDIFGNQARIAAECPPPELHEQQKARSKAALERSRRG